MARRDQSEASETEETDLHALLLGAWSARVPAFVALIAVSLGYWGIWAVQQMSAPVIYSRIVQFTFPQTSAGEYPNGSPLHIADLTSPGVLTRVYKANRLAERGVDKEVFVESFGVQAYIPDYNMIIAKYQKAVERKGIRSGEIDVLQDEMKAELARRGNTLVRLSFTDRGEVGLNEHEIDTLLLDVPRHWAGMVAYTYGSIYPDVPVHHSELFDLGRYGALDYLVAGSLLQDNINLVLDSIETLMSLPNGKVARDEKTGNTLPDLEQLVIQIADYVVAELSVPIQSLGIAKDRKKMVFYFPVSCRKKSIEEPVQPDIHGVSGPMWHVAQVHHL